MQISNIEDKIYIIQNFYLMNTNCQQKINIGMS